MNRHQADSFIAPSRHTGLERKDRPALKRSRCRSNRYRAGP